MPNEFILNRQLIYFQEECVGALQDFSEKVNSRHPVVHSHLLLSIFKMAEVEVVVPASSSSSPIIVKHMLNIAVVVYLLSIQQYCAVHLISCVVLSLSETDDSLGRSLISSPVISDSMWPIVQLLPQTTTFTKTECFRTATVFSFDGIQRDHFWLVYTYQLNPPLGTAKTDVPLQSGPPYGYSGVHGQFNRSNLLWKMTVGVGGICSLTSEVLVNLNKGVPPPAYFDCRGSFRAGLPFFQDDFEMRRPLLHNLTHPEYPITPEAAKYCIVKVMTR
ncbi:hypothetical protein J6590_094861 [Homalodisca vitripennis]|nr:hypothetical protein J6590_094861 [Homalodisca vitripennis]